MPLITYIVIINLICIIYSRIFGWVIWVVVDKFPHIKTHFWDKIIHQIRDHLISLFIAATWIVFQTGEGGGGVEIYMKHYSSSQDEVTYEPWGGMRTPILEDGGEFPLYWPPFLTFSDPIGSFFMPDSILLTLSFCRKICCLSHLVPEIIWHKVGLFFHKNLSVDTFEAICTTFLLDFWSCWPPFSLLLDIFDSSFKKKKLRSHWVYFFHCMLDPTENLLKFFCFF